MSPVTSFVATMPARNGRWPVCALVWLFMMAGCGWRDPAIDQAASIRRGDALVESKKFREAATEYRRALQADSLNGSLRLKVAEALLAAQDFGNGAREMVRAADLLPGNLAVQLRAASMLLLLHRFGEAAERVSGVLREQPSNVEALIVLANATAQLQDSTWALYVLRSKARRVEDVEKALREIRPRTVSRDDDKAEELFRNALELAPQAYEPRVALVNFLWAAGRQAEAEPMLREMADRDPGHGLLNQVLGEYYVSRGRADVGERYLKNAAANGDRSTALALVDFYTASGRDAEALPLLDRLEDSPPGSVSLARAGIEFRRGQRDEALGRVEQLLARIPQHADALQLKAEFLLAMGRGPAGLEVARRAVIASPSSAAAHFVLGLALSASGAPDEAFDELTEAVRLDPGHRPASGALARQAVELGRTAIAVALARQLVRSDPSDEDAAVTLVTALVRQRDTAGAAEMVGPLLARFPTSAGLLTQQGHLQVARARPGARASYERALALRPDSVEALRGVVSLDLAEGQPAAARRRVARALERQPDHGGYLLLLAEVLERQGDDAQSEATYRRVVASDAANVRAMQQLSALLKRLRRAEEARATLEQLLERRPRAVDARMSLATLLEEAGRPAEAKTHYKKVLDIDPRAAVAAYRLASLQVEDGENLDVALDLAAKAVQALPDDPAAKDVMGWIHVRKNLPRTGLPYLEDSVRAEAENPIYRYHLGMAYLAIGERDRGRQELVRALTLNPSFRFASQAKTALGPASRP